MKKIFIKFGTKFQNKQKKINQQKNQQLQNNNKLAKAKILNLNKNLLNSKPNKIQKKLQNKKKLI